MSDVVIKAEGLGKQYVLGQAERERYVALRDVLARSAKALAQGLTGRADKVSPKTVEDFWALRGVDFEIRRGELPPA